MFNKNLKAYSKIQEHSIRIGGPRCVQQGLIVRWKCIKHRKYYSIV